MGSSSLRAAMEWELNGLGLGTRELFMLMHVYQFF